MVYLMDFNLLWISIPATVCTTTASIPQIIHARTKLSFMTIAVRFIGCILWTIYGAIRQEYVLSACSAIAAAVELTLYAKTFLCPTTLNDTVPSSIDAQVAQMPSDEHRAAQ